MPETPVSQLTPLEICLERASRRLIARAPRSRLWAGVVEFGVFGAKQAWACVFGASMLAVLLLTRLLYPDDTVLNRNDFLTLAAVVIQVLMVAFRLETWRELRVVILFHLVGTGMELFKTSVGSWGYEPGGGCTSARCRCSLGSCTRPSGRTWSGSIGSSTFSSTPIPGAGSRRSSRWRSTSTSSPTTTSSICAG